MIFKNWCAGKLYQLWLEASVEYGDTAMQQKLITKFWIFMKDQFTPGENIDALINYEGWRFLIQDFIDDLSELEVSRWVSIETLTWTEATGQGFTFDEGRAAIGQWLYTIVTEFISNVKREEERREQA